MVTGVLLVSPAPIGALGGENKKFKKKKIGPLVGCSIKNPIPGIELE